MRYFLIAVAVTLLLADSVLSQSVRERASANPLDCALYLLSKNDDPGKTEVYLLSKAFLDSGRYDDALKASHLDDEGVYWIISAAEERRKLGDNKTSRAFILDSHQRLRDSVESLGFRELATIVRALTSLSETAAIEDLIGRVDDEDKFELVVEQAKALFEQGDRVNAVRKLSDAFGMSQSLKNASSEHAFMIAGRLAIDMRSREHALAAAEELSSRLDRDDSISSAVYVSLFALHNYLGDRNKAAYFWNRNPDKDGPWDRTRYISMHIDAGYLSTARTLLSKTPVDRRNGGEIVKQYIRLGDLSRAEFSAHAISEDPDSYSQQEAFMHLVDYFLAKRDVTRARKLLNYALTRATAIPFKHEVMDSVGASSGSRRSQMAYNIRTRFEELGDTEGAWAAVNALNEPHPYAQEKFQNARIDFVVRNFRDLNPKRVKLLHEITLNKARSTQDDSEKINLYTKSAEVYALRGEKVAASDLLAEMLEDRFDDDYLIEESLIESGIVFERYGLPSTARLQSVLTKIAFDNE